MGVGRREFLLGSGLAMAAGSAVARQAGLPTAPQPYAPAAGAPKPKPPASYPKPDAFVPQPGATTGAPPAVPPASSPAVSTAGTDWNAVKAQFQTAPDEVNMSAMLIATHPLPVRRAIDQFRREMDWRPVTYLEDNNRRLQAYSRAAAGRYLGLDGDQVALTDSTTLGAALVYGGLKLGYGDEIVTTNQDYYITHESLRRAALRNGSVVKRIDLFDSIETVSEAGMVARLMAAVTPKTRAFALTWVHSSTGLKLPLPAISAALAQVNATRQEPERIVLAVDGVHGFGNQDATLASLGCDIFMAGCHKWLFGPRGTGVMLFSPRALARLSPTIPTFLSPGAYSAWLGGYDPGPADGARMTPGGFKAFEHVWSLAEAFQFHQMVGKAHVAARTHELASRLKTGLAAMPHVRLVTPADPNLSAGIVSFDVAGLSPQAAVQRLRTWRVIGSDAPYSPSHVRLTPSLRNTPQDVDFALQAVAALV